MQNSASIWPLRRSELLRRGFGHLMWEAGNMGKGKGETEKCGITKTKCWLSCRADWTWNRSAVSVCGLIQRRRRDDGSAEWMRCSSAN